MRVRCYKTGKQEYLRKSVLVNGWTSSGMTGKGKR